MAQNRYTYISYLRVIAMFMVVMNHALDYYTPIWNYQDSVQIPLYYALARILNYIDMPIFVLVSGFLYYYQIEKGAYIKKLDFAKGKAKRLFIPFLVWSAIVVLFISNKSYIEFIVYGASHLWFLGMLLILFMLFHSTQRIWSKFTCRQETVAFAIMFLVSIVNIRIPSNPGFILHQVFAYMYVFYAGMMMRKHSIYIKHNRVGGGVGLLAIVILCVIDVKGIAYLMKPLTLWTVVNIFMYAQSHQWNDSQVIRIFDSCSMGIYLIHHVLIQYFLTYSEMREVMNTHLWMPFVICPVLVVLSLALTLLLKKIPYIKVIIG